MSEKSLPRTERAVIEGLTSDAQQLLKRVLEIERSKLHLTAADESIVDEILKATKAIVQ